MHLELLMRRVEVRGGVVAYILYKLKAGAEIRGIDSVNACVRM